MEWTVFHSFTRPISIYTRPWMQFITTEAGVRSSVWTSIEFLLPKRKFILFFRCRLLLCISFDIEQVWFDSCTTPRNLAWYKSAHSQPTQTGHSISMYVSYPATRRSSNASVLYSGENVFGSWSIIFSVLFFSYSRRKPGKYLEEDKPLRHALWSIHLTRR